MKNKTTLVVALLSLVPAVLLAQDAAAPIRRSPTPEATATPTATPAPTAVPTPTPAPEPEAPPPLRAEPAQQPPAPQPEPEREPQPEPPTATPPDEQVQDTTSAAAEQQAAPAPAPAQPAGRGVINERPVRAVEPRAEWTPRVDTRPARTDTPRAAATPRPTATPAAARPGRRPTFDLANVGGGSVAAQVKELERRWQQALLDRDIDVIRELVASDFVGTSTTGRTANKSTLLAEFRRDRNKYETATVRGMSVRTPSPDVAIVTGVATETGTTPDGKRFRSSRRFTDTWVNRDGRWRCVASHTTAL
jgi:uncharacterized protein (TIGR02246 family)